METKAQEALVLSENDKEALLAGLKAGLGLTQCANIILISPKELSTYLLENEQLLKECERSVKYAAKVLLVLSNQYLKERKYKKWKENNEYIRSFVCNIHLWESYCVKEHITNFKAAEAFVITGHKEEAATICGMTKQEYNLYLLKNPNTKQLIEAMLNI